MITYGSVCSGIEAASVAWEPLGFAPMWFSEIEPFPCAVLQHHWPHVPNFGDMNLLTLGVRLGTVSAPEVLVGGTPCQAFSVAGTRNSLEDERGQLTLQYVRILNAIDDERELSGMPPAVCVWENVPGVLSTKDNAFGCFLGELAGSGCELQPPGGRWKNAGYVSGPQRAIAWRVIDAQYFGVAQRRRRVFLVASAREGFDPRKVLFESEGVRRDTAPSREAGQDSTHDIAPCLRASGVGVSRIGDTRGHTATQEGYALSGFAEYKEGVGTLRASGGDFCGGSEILVLQDPHWGTNNHPVVAVIQNATAGKNQNGLGIVDGNQPAYTLDTRSQHAVATLDASYGRLQGCSGQDLNPGHSHLVVHGTQDPCVSVDVAFCQGGNNGGHGRPRRLTEVECARLQGFPDRHTLIPWRGKPVDQCPSGPQYKAYGNSKAVVCVRWLGERLKRELLK